MRQRRRARRLVGLAAAALLAAGIVALVGSPAAAHANLVATNPSSGSELDHPPDEVRLRFSERVTVAPSGVSLRDSTGTAISTDPATVAPEDPTAVVLPVPADLPDGSYVLTFRVISADSHPVTGAVVFGVGVPAGSLAEADVGREDPVVAAAFAAARWTSYAALALLGGGLGMLVLCWPEGFTNRRARRVLLAGWVASLAGGAAVLLLQGPYGAGRSLAGAADPALLSATMDTDFGRYVVIRLGLVGVAGVLLLSGLLHQPAWHRARTTAAVLVAVGLPVTWVGTGHANTADNLLDPAAEVIHLVAMSAWFGGLALLATSLLPRSADLAPAEVAAGVRRFSLLATSAVVTLVVTGTYIAWQRVGAVDALVGTPYGRLLAFKLAIMGVLLWFGSMSRSVVQRRYASADGTAPAEAGGDTRNQRRAARAAQEEESAARGQLRGSVRLEAVTALAVLAVASVLVATPPGFVVIAGEELEASAGPVQEVAPLGEDSDAGVRVLVDPAWVGENRVVVEVVESVLLDADPVEPISSPAPGAGPLSQEFMEIALDVPEIRASFVLPEQGLGPLPVELTRTGPGTYQVDNAQLPAAGQWRLDITVRTSDIDSSTVQIPVPVT